MKLVDKKDLLLLDIRKKFSIAQEFWSPKYNRFVSDLEFLEGTGGHWDEEEKAKRERRGQACLTMKVVNKYAKKLVGEIRLNKVKINVTPGSADADYITAQTLKGKVKDIEYQSDAEGIYDYAVTQMVEGGFGAWRILSKYRDDDPFEQDPIMTSIENPTCVFFDPNAKNPDFSDANYCFITTTMSEDEFKREFPGKEFPTGGLDDTCGQWIVDDQVVVSEYYYKDYFKETFVKLSDGQIMKEKEYEEYLTELQIIASQPTYDEMGNPIFQQIEIPTVIKKRECEKYKIKWIRLSGTDILDEKDVPGQFIPVVLCCGEMRNIKGEKYFRGLIHDGIDAARMADFWYTAAAEQVALSPKARYMLTPDEVSGYEAQFASNDNLPYFLFNLNPHLGRPTLEQPQTPPTAILSQLAQAEENVKGAIGMYDADLGDQGRELSGAAINARQTPSQISNFVYYDNLTKSIAYSGKIIVSMIGEIIDTERDLEIRNEDDSQNFLPVNTTIGNAIEKYKKDPIKYSIMDMHQVQQKANKEGLDADFNNLAKGKYNVFVNVGPAFETQRIEAAQRFIEMMGLANSAQGPLSLITLYHASKNMNFEGSDEFAESIRKMIPFGLLKPKPGEQPPPPQQPTPQEQMQAEILMLERRNQEAKAHVEEQRLKTEAIKQQRLMLDSQIDLEKARIEGIKADREMQAKIMETNAKMQRMVKDGL